MLDKTLTALTKRFGIDLHYFAKGGFWLSVTQVVTIFGSLIVSVVFANLLDETEYGVYRYILSIGALLTVFSLTGMSQSIFQTSAQGYTGFYTLGIRKSLLFSSGITVASLVGSVYYYFNDNIELALGCALIALFQPLLNTFQQIFPFLQGQKRFRESTLLQGLKTVSVTAASIGAVLFSQNALVLVLVYLLSNTLVNIGSHLLFRPKTKEPVDEKVLIRYMQYAKNTSVRGFIGNIAFRIDSIIVFQQLGAAELAIYTIANILPEHIKGSFKNLATLLVPKYVQHEDLEVIRKSMLKRSTQLILVFTAIMIAYIFLVPFVYMLIFPKYEEAILYSQLLALSFPAMIALLPISALQAHTEEKKLTWQNNLSSVIMLILTIVLTITHGLLGAILARVLSRYVNMFLTFYFLYKK